MLKKSILNKVNFIDKADSNSSFNMLMIALSPEIFLKIFAYITNPEDLFTLMLVNQSFFRAFNNQRLWRNITHLHFQHEFFKRRSSQENSWLRTFGHATIESREAHVGIKEFSMNPGHIPDTHRNDILVFAAVRSADLRALSEIQLSWHMLFMSDKNYHYSRDFFLEAHIGHRLYEIIGQHPEQALRDYLFNQFILPEYNNALTLTWRDCPFHIFHWAVICNQLDFVEECSKNDYFQQNDVVHLPFSFPQRGRRYSALMLASLCGHTEMVKSLLKLHANVYQFAVEQSSISPLTLAAQFGHTDVVQALLPNMKSFYLALKLAAENGHHRIVSAILEAGVDIPANTQLMLTVAERGHFKVFELLFEADLPFNIKDSMARSPLHLAILGNHLPIAERLLQFKAQLDDTSIMTLLFNAARKGHTETTQLLLEHGMEVTQKPNSAKALLFALQNKHVDVALMLINAGICSNVRDDDTHQSSLYYAVACGNHFIVDKLLEHNQFSKKELDLVLQMSFKTGNLAIIRSLSLAGADTTKWFRSLTGNIFKDIATKFIFPIITIPLFRTHHNLYYKVDMQAAARIELEKYILKTTARGENHYKRSLTIFSHTCHFGGYSSTEKLAAAKALQTVVEGGNVNDLDAHEGALNNGELKTIYRALMRR